MTNAPSFNRSKLLAVLGVFVLALVGVGFLILAVFLLVRGPGTASAIASPTRRVTQVVLIPTTTQSPPTATLEPTVVSTPTALPTASNTPAASATTTVTAVIKIAKPANVRTGPGLTYPPVGGLNIGDTAPVIGRDSSAQWFAISFDGAPQGTGWVSALVASFNGTINDLPVIQPAAPPPAATAVPATNTAPPANNTAPPAATSTPNVQGAGGIETHYFRMHKTSGAVNESMFFDFEVVNTTGSNITFGLLAAHTDAGVTAASWDAPLVPGKVLTWTDHINFPSAGTYQVYLGICYSSHDACKLASTPWVRLSNSIAVTIQ